MKQKAKQQSFQFRAFNVKYEFGGSLLKNSHAKSKRIISTKHAIHVVLHSDVAKGSLSMKKHRKAIEMLIRKQAKISFIKIYQLANAGNHLHLLIYLNSNSHYFARKCLNRFLRSISGLIPRVVLGVERGKAKSIKFWSYRPYTRVVVGFVKAYNVVKDYVIKNHLESIGVIPYQEKKTKI